MAWGTHFKTYVNGYLWCFIRSYWKFLRKQISKSCFKWSKWLPVKAGVPKESNFRTLFFLIYINDLPIDILSTVKLFADDTSVFSIIHNKTTAHQLNEDLEKKAEWVHKWKMSFHPNLNNQAQEVIFLND